MSDTDIREKEEQGVLNDLEKDFSPEEKEAFSELGNNDPENKNLYSPKDSGKKNGTLFGKKMAIGGFSGLLVGGGIWGMAFIQGPLQFMQLSQLMQKFHLTDNTSLMDNRYGKIYRYVRFRDNPELRRLGILGNKIVPKIDAKMAEVGLAFEYENGTQKGIRVVDPDKGGMRRMQELGYEPRHDGRGFIFETDQPSRFRTNNRAIRTLNAAGLTSANHGKRAGAIHKRVQNIRSNATFRFLGRFDARVDEAKLDTRAKYREKWRSYIKRGADANVNVRAAPGEGDVDTNNDDTPDPNDRSQTAANELDEAVKAGEGATGTDKVSAVESEVRSKLGKTNAALIGVTLACIANQIANGWDEDVYEQIIMPSIRMATGAIVIGDQLRDFSHQDFDIIEASVRSEQLFDEEGETSWAAAQSIQTNLGNEPDGPEQDLASRVGQTQNPVLAFIGGFPGLTGVCGVVNNTIVNIGISIVTNTTHVGRIADLGADYLIGEFAGPLISLVSRWLSLEQIPADVAGAEYGYVVDQGARMMGNDSAMSYGGVELTPEEELAWKEIRLENEKVELANMSLSEKLFSFENTDSVTSRLVRSPAATNPKGAIQSVAISFFSGFSSLGNSVAALFTSPAKAQSTYEYDFAKYGFSVEDVNDATYENPLDNEEALFAQLAANKAEEEECERLVDRRRADGENVTYHGECEFIGSGVYSSLNELNSGDSDYLHILENPVHGDPDEGTGNDGEQKANGEACFATSISHRGDLSYDESINFLTMPDRCKEERRQDFMRYRFYMLDLSAGHAGACYAGDETSCEQLGGQSSPSTEPTASSGPIIGNTAGVGCASGTVDEGEFDGYNQGEKYRIRICSIPDFPSGASEDSGAVRVNSTVSQNWLDLYNAAKSDGVNLRATSSFRSMDRQEYLYGCYQSGSCNNGNEAARPGFSNHQSGLAVDIDINPNGRDPSLTTCQANPSSYPTYEWLGEHPGPLLVPQSQSSGSFQIRA